MFTLNAFYTAALTASSTLAKVNAVVDQSCNVQNNSFQFPENRTMLGGWAAGTSLALAEMDSATLLLNGRPVVTPVNVVAPGGTLPGIEWPGERGYTLPGQELISMLASTDASGNADTYGAIMSTRGLKPIGGGPIRTVRATAACAGAKGSWFLSPLTFDTYLSQGKYALVGAVASGANLALTRFVFPNQIDRPGMVCSALVTGYVTDYFRFGKIGVWGTFDNYNPPQVECLGFGTLAAQIIYLDLMKIG